LPPDPPLTTDAFVSDERSWRSAIDDPSGAQLVVAGPGTGKTQFLADRAVHLLSDRAVDPSAVVVLTFSRRAAGELSTRVAVGLDATASGLDVSTFHSFAHRLLESHGDGGLGTLLTGPEQIRIVSELLSSEDPDDWPLPFRPLLSSHTFAEEVADFLLRCQERLIDPDALEDLAGRRADWRGLPAFFRRYDHHLREIGRLDYGTLLVDAIGCLRNPEVSAAVGTMYRYVLVDEYQDTSPAQAELLRTLTSIHGNITVAGDPYQSIYSFRGAELGNVASFPATFGTARRPVRRVLLVRSFRVPKDILDGALRITAGGHLPGEAGEVQPAPHVGRVEAHVFDQQSAEAEWIASEVERLLVEERLSPSQIGVLMRSKKRLLPELSRALDRHSIQHERPDSRLVDHPIVRVVIDLTVAAAFQALEPEQYPGVQVDLDRAMRRLLLGPLFGLPIMTERDLLRHRHRTGDSWPETLAGRLDDGDDVAALLSDPSWATRMPAAEGFWHAWTSLRVFRRIANDPDRSDDRRALAAFAQTLNRQADRDSTLSLLGYAERAEADDFEATPLLVKRRTSEQVALTTLHQAKGLEFEVVFVADATEGVFPDVTRPRSFLQPHLLSPERSTPETHATFRLQEEMRLAYTAMTRARTRVIWTSTAAGIDEGNQRPSRFLLASVGAATTAEIGPGPDRAGAPVSMKEIETALRRSLVDPTAPPARRLAAASTLASPPFPDAWAIERFAGAARPGPDTGVVAMPLVLSPSQAESYEMCPRRHVLERRLRLLEPSSPYLDFGALIHRILERTERAAMEQARRSTLDEALAALDAEMTTDSFGPEPMRRAWRHRGEQLLDRLYREWPVDSHHAIALERPLRLRLGNVEWRGRADRIELTTSGSIRVIDFKTGTKAPTRADAAVSLQLAFYHLAVASDPAFSDFDSPATAELWYPMSNLKTWRLPLDTDRISSVVERMAALADGIRNERWHAQVSARCARCPVRVVCDRWPEGREAFIE
jgi:superfamily I DNA/RNA helicase/RecB family exonuclease